MHKKLAIIITHPIQYYAPVFQLLAKEIDLKVFYTGGEGAVRKFDNGFRKEVEWDIPLLEGYDYEFLENTAKRTGKNNFWSIQNPSAIKKINNFKPDAILVYGWSYVSHLKIIRHYKGKIPVYFRGDSTLLDERSFFKSISRKLLLSWVYKSIDKALYVGSANKDYFKYYGLKDHQLFFAPHSVDNARFAEYRNQEALDLRENLGIDGENILILFAGKLEPKKDPGILLDAFIALNPQQKTNNEQRKTENEKRNKTHLLFVGNGVLEESLKTTSEKRETNIHFMDFQNQSIMPIVYQACDLFCLPSKGPNETWGLAVNEAMAAGKSILVSNRVGCATDLIKEDVNGAIFESGNLNDLIKKLQKLCTDKEKLISFGKQSKNFIKKWSFKNQVESILNTVNQKK